MEYFWEYLADSGTTEQKEFLGMIDPYSPVHLSLMQKINNYKSNLDDDSDVDKDEEKYWEALEELSSAISSGDAGSLSSTTLGRLFPKDDDDEIEVGDVVDDIFGKVSEILDEGGTSSEVGDFISAVKKGESFSISDVEDIQEFSKGLFSNSSPILFLLKEEDGGDTVNKIFEELLSQLSSADHQTKVNFLRGINPESEFFDYLEDMGFEHILEIIEADEEDFNVDDYDEEEIDDFFENEFIKLTKIWYGSEVSSDYLNDLADATDSTEIKDILEKAEDEGVLESVLYAVASDNFEDGSAEFYNIFFKALRTTSDYADIFMNGIEPNSNLGRTFSKLIDNEIEPFTNLSYDVDKDTGNIDFGSSERKLLTILSNTNMEGTNIFFDTLETIQEEFEDAVGTDNRAIDKLIEYSQKKELSDDIFDDLLAGIETEDGEIDYSKAEDILDIIADNDSVLFKTLGEEQLGYLLEQFLSWITAQDGEDGLLEYFGGSLDEDSLLYKAFIKGGADADDFQDGDYNAFLNGVNNSDDAAIFIKQALKYNTEEGDITQFVTDRLQGTQGNDIDDAVEDIIEYAAADEQSMNDLIIEVASGGSNITSLDKKQLETLIKEIFDYIAKQKPAEDEDISEVALLFLDNITEGTPAYTIIQQEYPILADYLTIASTDKEYDDRDIASELKKLLVNKQLVNAYVQKATGTNETKASDNSDSTVSEDDGDYSLVEDDEDTDSNNVGNSFEEEEFSKATDAALAALSKTMNVAGEPDIDSGVLSDIFFEEYTVEDLSDAATDGNFTTQEVIGTLQLIPLDKQPDFIREYMADKSINPETRDYLLGRLMIMITNQEVGTRTSEAILENVGITNLTPQIIEKIMDNWAETMDKYTDASATAIDDTYEQVLAATGGLKPENNNNNFDSDVSPYGMPADSQEYGYGNPYGMMGGGMMGSPYGMMGMGGFSPYGMMGGMMGMGAMNMNPLGMYPSGMDMSYQAGYTAGMYQGIIQTGFNLGLSSGLPNMGTSPVGGTGMMQQPSSNVVLNISGNNNNISLGSSSQQSSTPQQASTRTADSVPTTAGTPSTKASIRDRRQND